MEIVDQPDPADIVGQPIQHDAGEILANHVPDPDEEAMIKCLNWTPLHVAASRGHLEESHIALLNGNPALAGALDSQQRSLLHLASANGHVNVVTQLLRVRPEMCLARDRDGANPLHAAAIRGMVDVLELLFNANPHSVRARTDCGDSILHLCVKYGQLPSLRMLWETASTVNDLVDAVDNDGNTVLHLAVANRNLEIVEYILYRTSTNINKINANEQTAMDVLLLTQRLSLRLAGGSKLYDDDDFKIQAVVEMFGGKKNSQILFDPARDSDRRNGIMVSAALFATLAFQAGAAPPGGVWQDDNNGHKSGKAVMASHYPTLYQVLLCCNVVGFTSSFLTIILMWLNLLYKVVAYIHMVSVTMGISILFIAATYGISLFMVSPKEKQLGKVNLLIEIFIPFTFMVAFFPLVYWKLRCSEERKNERKAPWDEEIPPALTLS